MKNDTKHGLLRSVRSQVASCQYCTPVIACRKSSKRRFFVRICIAIDIALLVFFSTQIAKKARRPLYIALFVSCICLLGFLLHLLFYLFRKAYVQEDVDRAVNVLELEEADEDFLQALSGLPTRFRYQELETATAGFSKKLGQGGFGSVYEGRLADGSDVAVKRLEREGGGQKEFCAEVATISRIRHVNLVCLKGFCAEGAKRLLVYEFMPKGSLDKWLFRDKDQLENPLDWETRFTIALETARGLAYLHEECQERILHLDVKPQNILLDEGCHAKVSDFGLSRSMNRDQSRLVTTMRGTPGYLAPEWLLGSGIDSKIDVYSYGIVLLELVCGRRCVDRSQEDSENWYLPAVAFKKLREKRVMEIVDPFVSLREEDEELEVVMKQAEMAIRIAMWCIQEKAATRPPMGSVVQMLGGNLEVMEPPQPASSIFFSSTDVEEGQITLDFPPLESLSPPAESLSLPR